MGLCTVFQRDISVIQPGIEMGPLKECILCVITIIAFAVILSQCFSFIIDKLSNQAILNLMIITLYE